MLVNADTCRFTANYVWAHNKFANIQQGELMDCSITKI